MIKLPEIGLGSANLLNPSLPEFIDIASRHGFRRITVRPHVFAEALRHGSTEAGLRRQLSDGGVEVTMIDALNNGLPGMPSIDALPPATRALMPPDVTQPQDEASCLRAANALGAGLLNVVAYLGTAVPLEQMAEAVSGICRRAAAQGVRIALEFLPESGIPDLAYAARLVDACGEPYCRLTLDVFHLDRSGGTVDDVRRLPASSIADVQISDRKRLHGKHVPFGGRLMPGDGDIPLADLVVAALDNSPDAMLDIEVLNADLKALRPEEAAERLAQATLCWRQGFENSSRAIG